jgi:rubredoxin
MKTDNGLKCVCGCTVPPDSLKCPACGVIYGTDKPGPRSGAAPAIILGKTWYSIKCPDHGVVRVHAQVSSPPVRCPFC